MTTTTSRSASALPTGALVLALAMPSVVFAEEPRAQVLEWETGAGKSYVIPAAEIAGFIFGLNAFNRLVSDQKDYDSDGHAVWKNLRTAPRFDRDPFSVNQLGHPSQDGIYHGLARPASTDPLDDRNVGL